MSRFTWTLMLFSLLRAVPSRALVSTKTVRGAANTRTSRLQRNMAESNNKEQTNESYVRLVSPAKNERVGKVLMLHGWAQNAWVFQNKSKGLTRKLNQAGYDCVFLEGPHALPMTSTVEVEGIPVKVENGKRENARAWFYFSEKDKADASLAQSGIPIEYLGMDESLSIIQQELSRDTNEYCAILGFSQGGVFAHILSILTMQSTTQNVFQRIQCAIIASGFPAQHVSNQDSLFPMGEDFAKERNVTLPSLHLIGKLDTSVRPELSLRLVNVFHDSQILWHEKGHLLPQKSAQCAELIAFLDRYRK